MTNDEAQKPLIDRAKEFATDHGHFWRVSIAEAWLAGYEACQKDVAESRKDFDVEWANRL